MEWGAFFLILAVAMLIALFIARPFYSRQAVRQNRQAEYTETQDLQRSKLMAEHERLLTALQELEFDHTLGKIPEEDYPQYRAELLQSGAEVLRQLDVLDPQAAGTGSAEDRIEAAVATRRADAARRQAGQRSSGPMERRVPAAAVDELEAVISARRMNREEKAAGFCPKCGKPISKSDRFCPKCGAAL